MSGPPTTLPFDLKELLTVQVTWEKFQHFDGHAEPSYAAPVTKTAWVEESGMIMGGVEADRSAQVTSADLEYNLFFAGDDADAQAMQVYDRFTLPTVVAGSKLKMQATLINTFFGPNFDNQAPWMIQVTLS